jgi:hypothetical protein
MGELLRTVPITSLQQVTPEEKADVTQAAQTIEA